MLKKPNLRELYDKTELFIRKKYDPARVPNEGARFFKALGEISSYSMYILIMFLFVESHQNFAKSMTISTLIVFSMASIQLKLPQQGSQESWFIQVVNRVPFLDRFCFFEINYMIKKIVYGNIFNCILHISRISDVNPKVALKASIMESQTELSRAMVMIELLVNSRSKEVPAPELARASNQGDQPAEMAPGATLAETQLIAEPAPVDLSKYGSARPDCIDSFRFVVERRKQDTIEFMTNFYTKLNSTNKAKSVVTKAGGWMRTLLVWGVSVFIVGSALYQKYNETYHPEIAEAANEAKVKETRTKLRPTADDLTRRAEERERQEEE